MRSIHDKMIRIPLALLLLSVFVLALPVPVHADGGFPILGVLHAGRHPEAIAVDTQTHLVYIGYEANGLVVGFDPSTGNVRWRNTVGDVVSDVQIDSTRHRLYVASFSFRNKQSILSILDGMTGKSLLSIPRSVQADFVDNSLAVDTQRQQVYVSNDQEGVVDVFTLATAGDGNLSATASVLIIGPHPQALGVNSRLGRLYVGDAATNKVTVIDEESGHILTTLAVAEQPVPPLRVDEATGRVYVVSSLGQELDVIDGNTNTLIAHVPVSPFPEGVAFNTATGRIYVAGEGNKDNNADEDDRGKTITVVDGQTFAVLGTLAVGAGPNGVEADPNLRRVYVAVEDSNAVVEIADAVDIPLRAATTTQQVGVVHQAISLLQIATVVTLLLMTLTIVGATLLAQGASRRRRMFQL